MAYSTTHSFAHIIGRKILTVKANGGAVSIEVEHAPGVWVKADTYVEDGAFDVNFGSRQAVVRIVPTGAAEYNVL